ncbi:integrase catalytic domain-containing protein [Trichonephila clavipes]|nr:integrase catalytic domain-containing protein [Trichonephila clavipes]
MLRAWLIENDPKNWAIRCPFVQFQNKSSFYRIIKQPQYKALFETEPKTELQSSQVLKQLFEKLVTEQELDLLLNQKDHGIILTPKDLPAAFLESNDASPQKICYHQN